MRASLRPVLASIIMTEFEKVIADNLVKQGTIKFYIRYVDDTLLLVKHQNIDKLLKAFNGLEKNLKFTNDRFENEIPHFLHLEICPNGLSIFRKNTNNGQYIIIGSFILCKQNTAWINSLADRAKNVCSKENFPKEL